MSISPSVSLSTLRAIQDRSISVRKRLEKEEASQCTNLKGFGCRVLQKTMVESLVTSSHPNFAPNRVIDCKPEKLVDVAEIRGGAESAIEGGVVVIELLSVGYRGFEDSGDGL